MFKTRKFVAVVAMCMVALLAFSACGGGKKDSSAGGKAPKANPITDFKYELNEDGESVYIYDYIGTSSTVVFPAEIEGFPVTSISWQTCMGNKKITDVVIPEGIRKINGGDKLSVASDFSNYGMDEVGAFMDCSSLKSVQLPESLESIGKYAFQNCKSLTDINIPAGLKSIGNYAFYNTLLSNMKLSESIESLEFVVTGLFEGPAAFSGAQPPLAIRKRLQDLGYKGSF